MARFSEINTDAHFQQEIDGIKPYDWSDHNHRDAVAYPNPEYFEQTVQAPRIVVPESIIPQPSFEAPTYFPSPLPETRIDLPPPAGYETTPVIHVPVQEAVSDTLPIIIPVNNTIEPEDFVSHGKHARSNTVYEIPVIEARQ